MPGSPSVQFETKISTASPTAWRILVRSEICSGRSGSTDMGAAEDVRCILSYCRRTTACFYTTMRVTIFGASGLLGKYLLREWKHDDVTGLSSRDVDIRDLQQVQRIVENYRPEWIVLAPPHTDLAMVG